MATRFPRVQMTQRGMALIAVLWLVAAMGLIITGVVQSVRSEVRTAGTQRQAVVAGALADAAILLALQNLHAQQKEPGNTIQFIPVQFEGISHNVMMQPLNGLIDINNAPLLLLAEMYRHVGGLNPDAAQAMAQATVNARERKGAKGTAQGFDAVEDLLRMHTMTYDLYAKIIGLVTADLKDGSGRVNALAAPVGVLQVLTGGDASRAAILAAQRNTNPSVMDTSFLKPELIEMTSSRSLRFQVQVDLPGGGTLQKAWNVYWDTDPRSGLPWRVLGTQQSTSKAAIAGVALQSPAELLIASAARQSRSQPIQDMDRHGLQPRDDGDCCVIASAAWQSTSKVVIASAAWQSIVPGLPQPMASQRRI